MLKRRFRRLSYVHNLKLKDTLETITACFILHNLCISEGDLLPTADFVENEDLNLIIPEELDQKNDEGGQAKRDRVCQLLD